MKLWYSPRPKPTEKKSGWRSLDPSCCHVAFCTKIPGSRSYALAAFRGRLAGVVFFFQEKWWFGDWAGWTGKMWRKKARNYRRHSEIVKFEHSSRSNTQPNTSKYLTNQSNHDSWPPIDRLQKHSGFDIFHQLVALKPVHPRKWT